MVEFFEFNGISSYSYGLIVSGVKTFGAPRRRVEALHVYGRNGDILFDEGTYDNIYISYDVYISDNFKSNAREIRGWLLSTRGYHELTDSYDPSHYRKAVYFNSLDYDVIDHLMTTGKATITFYAMPQRFDYGETSTSILGSNTITMTNPYMFPSKPEITVFSTGTVTINDTVITINQIPTVLGLTGQITIDCDTMQCYADEETSANDKVTIDEFPVLDRGVNTITTAMTDNTKKTYITPRFWTL